MRRKRAVTHTARVLRPELVTEAAAVVTQAAAAAAAAVAKR